jgi:kynurenine formamidase
LFDFGWGKAHWATIPAGFQHAIGWPGLARHAAELLVECGVKAVGTDCLSVVDPAGVWAPAWPRTTRSFPTACSSLTTWRTWICSRTAAFSLRCRCRSPEEGSPVRAVAILPE